MTKRNYLWSSYKTSIINKNIPNTKTWIDTLYHKFTFEDFHYRIAKAIESFDIIHIELPRGSAKSTIAQAVKLRLIMKFPDKNGLSLNNTASQAKKVNREARGLIEGRLQNFYGSLIGNEWNDTGYNISWRNPYTKGNNDQYLGVFGALTGGHFDWIFCDDLIDQENTATADLRNKFKDWFMQTVFPTLKPDGKLVWINTRYNSRDFSGEFESICRESFGDAYYKYPVNKAILIDENGNEYSYWDRMYPLDKLYKIRKFMTKAKFNCQYQNDPAELDDIVLWEERYFIPLSLNEIYDTKYIENGMILSIDPAFSEDSKADFSVLQVWGVPENNTKERHLIDMIRKKIKPSKLTDEIDILLRRYPAIKDILIESVFESKVLIDFISSKYRDSDITIYPYKPEKDKIRRFLECEPELENGFVKMRYYEDMLDELKQFGEDTIHDDTVDAMSLALTFLKDRFSLFDEEYIGLINIKKEQHFYERQKGFSPLT